MPTTKLNWDFPPKEKCVTVWPMLVYWLTRKMQEEAYIDVIDPPVAIHQVTFRRHTFEYCPFCGVKLLELSNDTPMEKRHP